MSKGNSLAQRSEKGLLTPDPCVDAIDAQPPLMFGVSRFDRHPITNKNAAFARAARVFGVPIVLSSVETRGYSGNTWSQVLGALAVLGNPTRSRVRLSASRATRLPAVGRFKRVALLDRSARSH
jgi:hypothetical protein